MKPKKNAHGGFDADSYPHYVYIRATGTLEVVEHVMAPTFRIVDKSELMKAGLQSETCDMG
jgi:hypothetical protein